MLESLKNYGGYTGPTIKRHEAAKERRVLAARFLLDAIHAYAAGNRYNVGQLSPPVGQLNSQGVCQHPHIQSYLILLSLYVCVIVIS